jgi:hypothetical protein
MAGILQAKQAGYPLGSLNFQDFDKLTLILDIASHRLESLCTNYPARVPDLLLGGP